ncbi:MAG: hypothetical protein EBQ95_04750 [Gammaproteobacteria bacterium]|nr:hypothetical protein [Gammaproteobacteria bacterium]
MLNKLSKSILLCSLSALSFANMAYVKKFNEYRYWTGHFPQYDNSEMAAFIKESTPLTNRLRDQWMSVLARKQKWGLIHQYYQPTKNVAVQCYGAEAYWQSHDVQKAIQIATPIWLTSHPLPKSCDAIFKHLNQHPKWHQTYWKKRILLALDDKQLLLARQLLNHGNSSDRAAADALWRIHNQPELITKIHHGPWHGEEVLYSLKRMIQLKRNHTEKYYHLALQNGWLNHDQRQRFIAQYALYQLMNNLPTAINWFTQIEGSYRNQTVNDWLMRYSIFHHKWSTVIDAINHYPKPWAPEQLYWQAQAKMHLNQQEQSKTILKKIAKERNYYGFLASHDLHLSPSFEERTPYPTSYLPKEYSPILHDIENEYRRGHKESAAILLNDFILELPTPQKSALVNWVANQLNWSNQAIMLSNQPDLMNQVSIRFPVKYYGVVQQRAKHLNLDPAYIYAIIRQESAFHPEIKSSVGARGLMQMMPRTAKHISRHYRIPYQHEKQLYMPQKNIELGTIYLSHLAKIFEKHPVLMAAAYNAGPQSVHRWIRQNPTPDMTVWIETLPFKETRNYVKNIVAFQTIYQHRLHEPILFKQTMETIPNYQKYETSNL